VLGPADCLQVERQPTSCAIGRPHCLEPGLALVTSLPISPQLARDKVEEEFSDPRARVKVAAAFNARHVPVKVAVEFNVRIGPGDPAKTVAESDPIDRDVLARMVVEFDPTDPDVRERTVAEFGQIGQVGLAKMAVYDPIDR
jgi:hypothetical protein